MISGIERHCENIERTKKLGKRNIRKDVRKHFLKFFNQEQDKQKCE